MFLNKFHWDKFFDILHSSYCEKLVLKTYQLELSENYFFSMYANILCDAGQVSILRYFEACVI